MCEKQLNIMEWAHVGDEKPLSNLSLALDKALDISGPFVRVGKVGG